MSGRGGVRIEVPPGSPHAEIAAAVAALGWESRQALVGAALCQWGTDYRGDPEFFFRAGGGSGAQPRRLGRGRGGEPG